MAHYPDRHFIKEFAKRTLENFQAIKSGEKTKWDDTALISFLLAVFVVPHERADQDKYMAELLKAYPAPLKDVVEILRERPRTSTDSVGELPSSLDELPKYLRHAVAHFNIRPESKDEQNLSHLLIWNRLPVTNRKHAGQISFVARVNIDELRGLAAHILRQLSETNVPDRYEGADPIKEFDSYWKSP